MAMKKYKVLVQTEVRNGTFEIPENGHVIGTNVMGEPGALGIIFVMDYDEWEKMVEEGEIADASRSYNTSIEHNAHDMQDSSMQDSGLGSPTTIKLNTDTPTMDTPTMDTPTTDTPTMDTPTDNNALHQEDL